MTPPPSSLLERLMASGRPARVGTVTLVVDAGSWLTGRPPEAWAAADMSALSWFGLLQWCQLVGVDVPDDAGAALRFVARELDGEASRGLAAAVSETVGTGAPGPDRHRSLRSSAEALGD